MNFRHSLFSDTSTRGKHHSGYIGDSASTSIRNTDRSFSSQTSLLGDHHSSSDSCPYCKENVPKLSLKAHVSDFHGSAMPYSCSVCGKGYESYSGLYLHMNIHEGKKIKCPVCDRKFARNYHMKRHLKVVHSSAQCTRCRTVLKAGPEFNQHLLYCNM